MEKLQITITKESQIDSKELAEFIKNFNLIKNEKVKKNIIKLVESIARGEGSILKG